MAEEKQDVKWILVISLILFFVFEGAFYNFYYYPPGSYVLFNIWWYIYFINLFFIILAVISSTLNKVGFWDKELTYQLAVYSFIVSMALIFVSSLRMLPFTL
jgi:hypothetical protein